MNGLLFPHTNPDWIYQAGCRNHRTTPESRGVARCRGVPWRLYAENRSATPPDPQEVADAVAHVIAQPAGERPLRTVVATVVQRQAPQALNDAATHAMQSFLEALNIPLATLAIKGEEERKRDGQFTRRTK